MVELYTLPTCGICNMIKTKLKEKSIPFEEKNFQIVADSMKLERAPVLHIVPNENEEEYIMSPTKIVAWINRQ